MTDIVLVVGLLLRIVFIVIGKKKNRKQLKGLGYSSF
jgi:hypothetical protein